ncbi:mitochondrial import inner membrane translocase subunit Tim13-like [Culicoides brevitarsis]|uniref:mitochondrial import inner membrane translocase subunit Tim13-like n=1 Tax=Culicoides brevitarsis TaxID=469753 RepID=UPI00307B9E7A
MSLDLGNLSSADKDNLMEQVQQQVAIANLQQMVSTMTSKCFEKCISKPGSELDSSDQKCLSMCMDRYFDTINTVSKTYTTRLQRESGMQ